MTLHHCQISEQVQHVQLATLKFSSSGVFTTTVNLYNVIMTQCLLLRVPRMTALLCQRWISPGLPVHLPFLQISDSVSDSTTGQLRIQYWRDVITAIYEVSVLLLCSAHLATVRLCLPVCSHTRGDPLHSPWQLC